MSRDEKELLDKFRKLSPENQAIALSNFQVAYTVQENMKKKSSRPMERRKENGQ